MTDKILDPYVTLRELFRSEQSAFEASDSQRLAALAPQIRKYCKRISEMERDFSSLTSEQIRAARDLLRRLQKDVEQSRASWQQYQIQLEEQRKQLQSSRQFFLQARLKHSTRKPRISHSA